MPKLDLDGITRGRAPADWGDVSCLPLGDAGGLTQCGVARETLGPGARTSDPHWHENEDEFVHVVSGQVTLWEDGAETVLRAGDSAAFPAAAPSGHSLLNRSDRPAVYLIVGTRAARDRMHYTTLDKVPTRVDGIGTLTRRDGTPLESEP